MDPRQFLAMEVWNVSLIYLVERMGRSMFFCLTGGMKENGLDGVFGIVMHCGSKTHVLVSRPLFSLLYVKTSSTIRWHCYRAPTGAMRDLAGTLHHLAQELDDKEDEDALTAQLQARGWGAQGQGGRGRRKFRHRTSASCECSPTR
jgi:hypothetical protein